MGIPLHTDLRFQQLEAEGELSAADWQSRYSELIEMNTIGQRNILQQGETE